MGFWETLADFRFMMDQFNRRASAACDELHGSVVKTRELVAQSRELIAKANKILERDRKIFGSVSASKVEVQDQGYLLAVALVGH
jgi:predicted metalloprotease with PDZ domain